jgi:hypothetical protein
MKYFSTLPATAVLDQNNNIIGAVDLTARASLIPKLSLQPLLFYQYTIQEQDTPENIAYKYYNDQYRYWMIFYANNIMDPKGDWPMSNRDFTVYLNDKYGTLAAANNQTVTAYCQSTIHSYQKVITTYDSSSTQTSIKTVTIDAPTYANTAISSSTATFPSGTVTYTVSKNIISVLDYENQLNESKRNINIINSIYANDIENQFTSLMNS